VPAAPCLIPEIAELVKSEVLLADQPAKAQVQPAHSGVGPDFPSNTGKTNLDWGYRFFGGV